MPYFAFSHWLFKIDFMFTPGGISFFLRLKNKFVTGTNNRHVRG